MSQKLTPEEFRERLRIQREVDRQSFRVHWKQVCLEAFLELVSNSMFGYALGSLLAWWSVVEVLAQLKL